MTVLQITGQKWRKPRQAKGTSTMSPQNQSSQSSPTNHTAQRRRDFFGRMRDGLLGAGLATVLNADLLSQTGTAANPPRTSDLSAQTPHFNGRAKSVIQFFMTGGPSQVDLFDPKPALQKHEGELPQGFIDNVESVGAAGGLLPSPFKFAQHGKSGLPFSELLPHLATCADDIAVIRSMWTSSFNHETGIMMMHSGRPIKASPSLGAWVTYGLGSENQNLPAYVALDDPMHNPILLGKQNWQSGFLPPIYQGTRLRSIGSPLVNLKAQQPLPASILNFSRDLLKRMAREHQSRRPDRPELAARIASYELAARMQLTATDAMDLTDETADTQRDYGLNQPATESYGRRCLLARRLVERGVRIVQIYMNTGNGDNPWDHHGDVEGNLKRSCMQTDQPVAALIKDLKQRSLLDSTLLVWGGEFGRLPLAQKAGKPGRDHGANGFSVWLAGGGIKGGTTYGETDDFGYHAVDNRVSVHDFHATLLHCLGLDHRRLVFNHHGLDERLSGVEPARVIQELLL